MDYFWSNTIWYILLGVLTLVELLYIMVKAQKRALVLAFYLTVAGITLTFETIILIFFKAYTYYPKILKNPPIPFDDVLAGNLFSQFSIAATVLLVAVFNLRYWWFFIFAFIYGAIEELFLALGIYEHNWYRTWMTVTILPFAFWIGKYLYRKINEGIKPIFYYIYIMFSLFPLYIITLSWALILFRLQTFSKSVLSDPIMSIYFSNLTLFLILALPLMFIYFKDIKYPWKTAIIIALYLIYYFGHTLDFIIIKAGWFFPISTLVILWIYGSIHVANKLYGYNYARNT